ncbi:RNA polymerase sigma factor [Methylophaga sp. OBS3]|uniref:RNA polymerase sigma factor n=1 Tax=Methylophaga sp. OBS3 TaxID=2991934 RepID=UPI002256E37C|nr:sigma-70 family RNA polymerase sigma factor [Methylophaga sp. OBS3]MCX4189331.1 sigma-70 family RNA polymerase sigma factor [Methylophaga sp. OBS3]
MTTHPDNPFADDKQLIDALLSGDAAAFDWLVSQHHNRMLAIANSIIGEAFAEEVVQEAWLSAINGLGQFAGRSSLSTWLIQITANGAKSRLRREKRNVSLDEGWDEQAHEARFDHTEHWRQSIQQWELATPEAIAENSELSAIIEQSFAQLPPLQQSVLMLFDLEQTPMPEICNILDISASNARVLLHRARATIQQKIAKYQDPK